MLVILLCLKRIETNSKYPKYKVDDRVIIINYKNIFSKDYIKNWSKEIFVIGSALKTSPLKYKIKVLKECSHETLSIFWRNANMKN